MTTTTAAAPTITRPGNTPPVPHKLFVNLPVRDVQRSIVFFEALGFAFNPTFTDATGTCMLVGTDAYVMLLTHEKFASFTKRPLSDAMKQTGALFAISMNSKDEVNALVEKAVASGGSYALEKSDLGFMYGWSFYDLDGHHWEVFWMDPAAIPG
jgi:predicted lactoylglutathione lyase